MHKETRQIPMENNISFLVVDDEEAIVISLKTLLSKSFPDSRILISFDGADAWEKIERSQPLIVICDITMPKMNGFQVLKKIREHATLNDIYFIMLTANLDRHQRIKALEEGADDFMIKPFSAEDLIARMRSASRYVALQQKTREENQLLQDLAKELERSFHDMTLLAVKFLQARIPSSTEMLKKVADASFWIARQLGGFESDQLQDIKIAAYLCYAGKICLPDNLLKYPVMSDGRPTDKLMFQVPICAKEIVSGVRRFKEVSNILYHLFENFDGSGFPDRLASWQIPVSSRIIRVALDYEEFRTQMNLKSRDAIERIKRETNRLYDPKPAALLDQYAALSGHDESGIKEIAVQLQELTDGMVLSRDIVTTNGLKLMPSGAVLHDNIIKRIFSHNSSDPILGKIFVKSLN